MELLSTSSLLEAHLASFYCSFFNCHCCSCTTLPFVWNHLISADLLFVLSFLFISCHSGQDPSGMGHQSFLELLGKLNKRMIIASVYCIGNQTTEIGTNTVSTQQTQILLQNGHHPKNHLINDLINQITQWQNTGYEILICMDTNKDTANPHLECVYRKLLNITRLIDLHQDCHLQLKIPQHHITEDTSPLMLALDL